MTGRLVIQQQGGLEMGTHIIAVQQLHENLDAPDWLVLDCQSDLMDKDAGPAAYRAGHIPGAVHVRLDEGLSASTTDRSPAAGGRHPLPAKDDLSRLFAGLGVEANTRVVAYDDSAAAFAARLWWLLRYAGHERVAVLDGGLGSWRAAGYAIETITLTPQAATAFCADFNEAMLIDVHDVAHCQLLIDSRAPARYRGEHEPIDPVAGHIPGALNRPWQDNMTPAGTFKPAPALRAEFRTLFAGTQPEAAVFYCGSGVTACHNILAAAHAGLPGAKLYPGSWSEWCADPGRPIATG